MLGVGLQLCWTFWPCFPALPKSALQVLMLHLVCLLHPALGNGFASAQMVDIGHYCVSRPHSRFMPRKLVVPP